MSFRPNRSLLEPNFAGYELAKGEKPILKETKLEEPTNVARLEENQFSYAHVRSFALHNHLFVDPWAKDVAYFVSEARNIFSVAQVRERSVSSPIRVTKVAELPEPASKSSTATNGSITFPADGLAVVSDGTGKLIVYETKDTWKCTWSTAYGKCGVVAAASRGGSDGKIACALVEIAPSDEKTVQIDWLVLIPDDTKGYGISLVQKVACLSWPILVAFESDCSALYLLSESTDVVREKNEAVPVRDCDADFSDSEIQELERLAKQKIEFVRETDEKEASQSPCQAKRHKNKERDSDNEEIKKLYQWSQTDDEVIVAFNLPRDVNRGEIVCKVEKTRLTFGLSDGTGLLNAELYGNVSPEGSCWTKEGRRVDVALEKEETGRFWPTLVSVKGVRQENVTDGESAKVDPVNKPLSEMTEVCDLAPDDESFLLKIDPHGKAICKASLGGIQWLFNCRLDPRRPPALCLRYDVDGIVWQLGTPFPALHVGTFNAFGYVQASKEQRKFSTCASDLSVAVICDYSRYVFIYEQLDVNSVAGGFLGRTARQHVVTLPVGERSDEILGLVAFPGFLVYVLTSDTLYVISQ